MNAQKVQFLRAEFERAMREYPESAAQRHAESVYNVLQSSGDVRHLNEAVASFMDSTSEMSSYDRELAYSLAGRGDPGFSAEHVPESVLKPERRADFESAVRTGQMDAAAAIAGVNQLDKIRAILRNLLNAINA